MSDGSLLRVIAQAQQIANSSGLVCRGSSTSWPQKMSACVRQREQLGSLFVKENNDNSFKCTEDRMKELTIQFFEMWAAKRQA